jgi:hypothetical protein
MPVCHSSIIMDNHSILFNFKTSSTNNNGQCIISYGSYEGEIYTKSNETVDNKCLIESPWMRVAQHSVKLVPDGGNDASNRSNKIVSDWLYIDYHDRINVLVEAPSVESAQPGEGQQFIILKQAKYALNDNVPSYAIVGGIYNRTQRRDTRYGCKT